MEKSNNIMKKKIHSVKSWLEKAESSYEDEAVAKGKLQLMLAKAEMRHLEETESSWVRKGMLWTTPFLLVLILGGNFLYGHYNKQAARAVTTNSVQEQNLWMDHAELIQNSEWNKGFQLQQNDSFAALNVKGNGDRYKVGASSEQTVKKEEQLIKSKVKKEKNDSVRTKSPSIDIMDAKEIQKTVYDAGRSLRGN